MTNRKGLYMIFTLLLCTCMALLPMHAQENADYIQRADTLQKADSVTRTACVPVMSTAEDSLVFQAGEELSFALQYTWGAMNTDVGHATIRKGLLHRCLRKDDQILRLGFQGSRGLQVMVHPGRNEALEVHP